MKSRSKLIFAVTLITFAVVSVAVWLVRNADAQKKSSAKTNFIYPLQTKLQRFEVIEGKEQKFKEWMDYLRREHIAAVATLEDEKTYFEAVFSEKIDGKTYAYWLTFKGEGGKSVESSTSELDRKHLEYWNECIKKDSRTTLETQFYLTPEFLDHAIARHQKTKKD